MEYVEDEEGIEDVPDEYVRGLPVEEYVEIINMRKIKNGVKPEEISVPKPLAKDWEIPELMVGWVFYILAIFGSFVFKDWYIKIAVQIFIHIWFHLWRLNKIYYIRRFV